MVQIEDVTPAEGDAKAAAAGTAPADASKNKKDFKPHVLKHGGGLKVNAGEEADGGEAATSKIKTVLPGYILRDILESFQDEEFLFSVLQWAFKHCDTFDFDPDGVNRKAFDLDVVE